MSNIAFIASDSLSAQDSLSVLAKIHGNTPVEKAEIIVALGGDGFMLEALHSTSHLDIPVYGMNRGTVGFLMNEYSSDDLLKRLNDKNNSQYQNTVGELNDRIIMPLFIPALILLTCSLIITNKEIINNNLLKILVFTYGISIIIISEILLEFSSKKIFASLLLYTAPLLFLVINWILLNYFLNRENIKS